MRHNWNYKTIGDVCTSVTDGSHNPPKGIDKSDYRMISSQNIFDDNLILTDDSVRYLSKENHIIEDKRTRLQKDVVLLTIVGTIGRACILTGNEGPLTLQRSVAALHPSEEILPRFLLHTLIGNRTTLNQEAHGIAQKGLYLKQLSALRIPVPTIEEQQKIVSELDKINELIRLKKEQLKDYDNLAQSIFYEMFGDPVVNEKGWKVKKIGEIGTVERGAGISKKDFVEDGLPCIHYGQLHTILGPTTRHHHSCIPESLLPKYKIAHTNDVIMAITSEDVEGSCKSTAWLGNYDIVIGSDAAILHHEQDGTFLSYYTMTKAFFNEKSKYAKGFKVTHISAKEIENIPVYLPPLALQKDFAKRIEVIEQQKENIKSTIQDLETLLASRMQYWFD